MTYLATKVFFMTTIPKDSLNSEICNFSHLCCIGGFLLLTYIMLSIIILIQLQAQSLFCTLNNLMPHQNYILLKT